MKEKIIKIIEEYAEFLKKKINDGEIQLIGNILSLTENILYYLIEHKNDLPIILDSKKVDQLTNEFYLIVSKDIDINLETKSINYNTLYLNAVGLYNDNTLVKVDLTINKGYLNTGEILTLKEMITANFYAFPSDVSINLYFKSNNIIKAYVVKNSGKIETFILED